MAAVATVAVLAGCGVVSPASKRGVTIVHVNPDGTGPQFAEGAVGFSTETYELGADHLDATSRTLVRLMRMLGPSTLRIGGNGLDVSWWTSNGEPPPSWATNVVTPDDLVRLRGFLNAAGWHVMLGLNLGHFDAQRAADEAAVATQVLGPTLLGFEVGNEPDGYVSKGLRPAGYAVTDYLHELAAYAQEIRWRVPGARLFGPDVNNPAWLAAVAHSTATSLVGLTRHFWPTNYNVGSPGCPATSMPKAESLLSVRTQQREDSVVAGLLAAARSADRDAHIDETNTTSSCDTRSSPGTNPVFTSALWSLDWSLRAASRGVAGISFHGTMRGCLPATFGPLCIAAVPGISVVRPEFYGLFAARQLEGERFLPVRQTGGTNSSPMSVYATLHPDRSITIAVVSFGRMTAGHVVIDVPGYVEGSVDTLAAPSIESTHQVTFAGGSFSPTGKLRLRPRPSSGATGSFSLALRSATAYILTLWPRGADRGMTGKRT